MIAFTEPALVSLTSVTEAWETMQGVFLMQSYIISSSELHALIPVWMILTDSSVIGASKNKNKIFCLSHYCLVKSKKITIKKHQWLESKKICIPDIIIFFHKMSVGCLFAVAVRATTPGGWGVPAGEGGDVSGRGQGRPGQQSNCIWPDPPVPQCHHCWSQAAVGQHQHGEGREWGVLLDIKIVLATMLSWSLLDYVVKQFHKHEEHTDSDYSSILVSIGGSLDFSQCKRACYPAEQSGMRQ